MSYRRKHITPKLSRLKPKKKFWQHQVFWFSLFFVLSVAAAIYFVLFLPNIQVQKLTISGNSSVAAADIEAAAFTHINKNMLPAALFSISSASMLVENTAELEAIIKDVFPIIKTVRITKQWPETLLIDIQERAPFAVFCPVPETITCFHIDESGVVFQEAARTAAMPTIYQQVSIETLPGDQAVEVSRMAAITTITNLLQQHFSVSVEQADVANPLIFTTSEGWKLYIDPDEDISLQTAKLDALLNTQIAAEERKNIQYIYLQYKDRAYYK